MEAEVERIVQMGTGVIFYRVYNRKTHNAYEFSPEGMQELLHAMIDMQPEIEYDVEMRAKERQE